MCTETSPCNTSDIAEILRIYQHQSPRFPALNNWPKLLHAAASITKQNIVGVLNRKSGAFSSTLALLTLFTHAHNQERPPSCRSFQPSTSFRQRARPQAVSWGELTLDLVPAF